MSFLVDHESIQRAVEREMAERLRYESLTVEAWQLYHALFAVWWSLPDLSTSAALRLRELVERAYRRALRRDWVVCGRPGPTPVSHKGGHGR